ncbi:hypothetical protein BIW11_13491 [Tropilaelaps mercedesae]|uniref:Uncharacterized protein n=1 Tax=Tropilaelaps mercedesae TaxID=418985 RepID=A0A1V9X282_9ACAR|nr:hypothetical protein BIW11_13491 [Tropilaelaps mercedesae]
MWPFGALSTKDLWHSSAREHGPLIQAHVSSTVPVAQVAPVVAQMPTSSQQPQGPRVAVVAPEPSRLSVTPVEKHLGSDQWPLPDSCEDPFSLKGWPIDGYMQQSQRRTPPSSRTESAFSFAHSCEYHPIRIEWFTR